jgi:hypothetical protein
MDKGAEAEAQTFFLISHIISDDNVGLPGCQAARLPDVDVPCESEFLYAGRVDHTSDKTREVAFTIYQRILALPLLSTDRSHSSSLMAAAIVHKLNDRVARSAFGRYFLLEGSGHPKERKGARFTTELRGGLTTFSSMVRSVSPLLAFWPRFESILTSPPFSRCTLSPSTPLSSRKPVAPAFARATRRTIQSAQPTPRTTSARTRLGGTSLLCVRRRSMRHFSLCSTQPTIDRADCRVSFSFSAGHSRNRSHLVLPDGCTRKPSCRSCTGNGP